MTNCETNDFRRSNWSAVTPKELSINIPMSIPLLLVSLTDVGSVPVARRGKVEAFTLTAAGSSLSGPGTLKHETVTLEMFCVTHSMFCWFGARQASAS